MPAIDEKISSLPPKEFREFSKILHENLNDEDWCSLNGINYKVLSEEEDIPKAKRISYHQMFG